MFCVADAEFLERRAVPRTRTIVRMPPAPPHWVCVGLWVGTLHRDAAQGVIDRSEPPSPRLDVLLVVHRRHSNRCNEIDDEA